jgi:tetratricopeptide (TPR) repeat protein
MLTRLGKHEDAIACFGQCININPKHSNAWKYKGFSLLSLNRIQEAANAYKIYIETAPSTEREKIKQAKDIIEMIEQQ